MKKRILSLILFFVFLTGCGGSADNTLSSNVSGGDESVVSSIGDVSASTSVTQSEESSVDSVVSSTSSNTSSSAASSKVTSTQKPQETKPEEKKPTHLIMMSDVHLEDYHNWYKLTSAQRMDKMVVDLNKHYQKDPYEHLFILGDTSLDFWENTTHGGSYRREGRSNTKTLIDDYLSRLNAKNQYIIPGNHEQYSNADWKKITGRDRQYSVVIDGWLFLMLDTFAGDLDPDKDAHGTYTGVDMTFVNEQMAKYPDLPVVLCAHYFYVDKESDLFRSLLKNKRIVCLFEGHDHVNTVETLDENCGSKKVFHCGQFSYTKVAFGVCPWGWRNVYLTEDSIKIDYYAPESIVDNGKTTITEGIKQTPIEIKNPMK